MMLSSLKVFGKLVRCVFFYTQRYFSFGNYKWLQFHIIEVQKLQIFPSIKFVDEGMYSSSSLLTWR